MPRNTCNPLTGYGCPEVRFWRKIDKEGPVVREELGPCWVWIGGRFKCGYGAITVHGKLWYANRYSWYLHHGEIPADLFVLHKCDNRECVNPDHLFLGTPQDNATDMVKKSRQARGERNAFSTITDEIAREVLRRPYKPWCKVNGARAIAKELGISQQVVRQIRDGKTWRHVQ